MFGRAIHTHTYGNYRRLTNSVLHCSGSLLSNIHDFTSSHFSSVKTRMKINCPSCHCTILLPVCFLKKLISWMYLVSSGSKHSFKHCNNSPGLWNSLFYAIAKSKLNFLLRVDFFPTGHWVHRIWPENCSAVCGSGVFSGTNVESFGWGLLEYRPPKKTQFPNLLMLSPYSQG